MATFEKSIIINRPQQDVFDFVSNPANDPQWQSTADSAEWTSEGPNGVGSTQRSTGKFLGRKMETTSEVTVWDAPNQFAIKSVGGPMPFEFSMKLASVEDGTQLSVNGKAEFGGFFKLAEGVVAKQAEKQFESDMESLKLLLEKGQA